jgi:hypothetical protein
MTKGDTIKTVDGQKAKSDNIATLLYGCGTTDRLHHCPSFFRHALPDSPADLDRTLFAACMCATGAEPSSALTFSLSFQNFYFKRRL